VSHDRAFLDDVVTSTLVLEGDGRVGEYVGGYEDWRRQTAGRQSREQKPVRAEPVKPKASAPPARRKLSYKDQRELDQLPGRIEALETEQTALHASLADPALYRGDPSGVVAARARLEAVEREIAALLERWEALAEIAAG
jgi:ATP-binding cassette subfamily F protein uup